MPPTQKAFPPLINPLARDRLTKTDVIFTSHMDGKFVSIQRSAVSGQRSAVSGQWSA
ncbi:hypothetical protein BJP36_39505 [Moorena producens JHB]|uniref:Uncharacterized protein n=1 Tax=Moorena producens (strain JHB) TaxID=1454205 RepID=A0A9Q9SV26_MOOP1|nr:hypothetical protein BJP36_39505 [Moorena producens JHB]